MAGTVTFVVAVSEPVLRGVNERAAQGRAVEAHWWAARMEWVDQAGSAAQRSARKAELLAERARLREAGELLGSRDALVSWHLRALLAERGWDRHWRPIPAGAAAAPGRPWGTERGRGGDRRLRVDLPRELAETVRRAAWWRSRRPREQLQAWRDAHPRGAPNARVEKLRAQILTPGDVLRAAAQRAGTSGGGSTG